jgi:predicted exporter
LAEPASLKRFVGEARQPWIHFVDLKTEAEDLVATYRTQALVAVGWGALIVIAALVIDLGWSSAILRVLWPIGLALGLTTATVTAIEGSLSTIHLVSFLLVAGIGIDYALFFNRPAATVSERERSSWGVLICALTTICVFAVLAFSTLPVLRGVGLTVALGAALAFISSAAYATLDTVKR